MSIRVSRRLLDRVVWALTLGLGVASPAAATTFTGPTPYTGFAGSPFDSVSFASFQLEDFEDGALNVPGVTATTGGGVLTFGDLRDSVEATPNGYSFYTFGTSILTFTFSGTLPTHAGVVWTDVGFEFGGILDGVADVIFEAFDEDGFSLGTIGPVTLGDGAANGGTAEDRFFGVEYGGGISKITLAMPTSDDWEMDHLQFGVQAIPEPSTAALLALGLGALRGRRRH
jgi:hypothetical protein